MHEQRVKMLGVLLALDRGNPRVFPDDCHFNRRKRDSAHSRGDFCRGDFRSRDSGSDYQPRHLRQVEHRRDRQIKPAATKRKLVQKKGADMAVWRDGGEMSYLYGENGLTPEQAQQAVNSLTYDGLQIAAASFFLIAQKVGLSPRQAAEILESGETDESLHSGENNRT